MNYRFPLKDVIIEVSSQKREVKFPSYNDGFYILNQNEFSMDVPDVGWFYASGGNFISIVPYPGADKNTIELYLNGSTYGAILHQRKILPLHGSSFMWNGKGILICGEAGVGKSSVTASFCLNGAKFLTDDVTPIVFENNLPNIVASSDRLKLWNNTLVQLNLRKDGLARIDREIDKYYYPLSSKKGRIFPLSILYIIDIFENNKVEFKELKGADKFAAIRNEIYRWEYLQAMPRTEVYYLEELLKIAGIILVIKVMRPSKINIEDFHRRLKENI